MSTARYILPGEAVMQQAWRYRLWGTGRLMTTQGKWIRVLDAGRLNTSGGPDFQDARISVDDTVLVGSIEIHRHASDWHRHGHDNDRAYDNVILHVVGNDDCRILRREGSEILQTEMRIEAPFTDTFNNLLNSVSYVLPMCGSRLDRIADIFRTDWLTSLAYERMYRKAGDITTLLRAETGDWLQVVFVTLARGLGFGKNADNMERLARSVSIRQLLHHSDNPEAVEAILFGQASLLNMACPADAYEATLIREYLFYSRKYGLTALESPVWQMNARNTATTPYRRIAMLAALVCRYGNDLGAYLSNLRSVEQARQFLNIGVPAYWSTHYAFGRQTSMRQGGLGKQSQDLLIINVLAPLIFARGLEAAQNELMDGAIELWMQTEPEQNSITRGFKDHGIKVSDAFTSQALIQLHRQYCERRGCLNCRIGHRLLSGYVSFKGAPTDI